jgi:hypothetical protein
VSLGIGRQVSVLIGDARVRIFDEQGTVSPGDMCRIVIDPYAVQVWPLAAGTDATAKIVPSSAILIDRDQLTGYATRLCARE